MATIWLKKGMLCIIVFFMNDWDKYEEMYDFVTSSSGLWWIYQNAWAAIFDLMDAGF